MRNSRASLSWARLLFFCFPFVKHKVWLWCCVDDYEEDATLHSEISGRTFWKSLKKTLQYNFMSCWATKVGRVPGKRLWYLIHDSTALLSCGVLSFSLKATTSIPVARVVLFISWQLSVVRRKNKQSLDKHNSHTFSSVLDHAVCARESPQSMFPLGFQ